MLRRIVAKQDASSELCLNLLCNFHPNSYTSISQCWVLKVSYKAVTELRWSSFSFLYRVNTDNFIEQRKIDLCYLMLYTIKLCTIFIQTYQHHD